MKRLLFAFLPALLCVGALLPSAFAQTAISYTTTARKCYMDHDLINAKSYVDKALQIDPTSQDAIKLSKLIEARAHAEQTGNSLETLLLSSIHWQNVTLKDALKDLHDQAGAASDGRLVVNYIKSYPPYFDDKVITLDLQNVPFGKALRYLANLVNLDVRVEKYAFLLEPIARGATHAKLMSSVTPTVSPSAPPVIAANVQGHRSVSDPQFNGFPLAEILNDAVVAKRRSAVYELAGGEDALIDIVNAVKKKYPESGQNSLYSAYRERYSKLQAAAKNLYPGRILGYVRAGLVLRACHAL